MARRKNLWSLRKTFFPGLLTWYQSGWRLREGEIDEPEYLGSGHLEPLRSSTNPPAEDAWALVEYASGGDYIGADPAVRDANMQIFLEVAKENGVDDQVLHIYGSHGWEGIVINGALDDAEIIDLLRELQEYPILNDDLHSEKESEYQNEAWDSWVASDFEWGLESNFDGTFTGSKEDLFEIFNRAAERANVYWEMENSGPWIDVDAVLESVTKEDLRGVFDFDE